LFVCLFFNSMSHVLNRLSSVGLTVAKKKKSEMVSKLLRKWVSTTSTFSAETLPPMDKLPWRDVAAACQLFEAFASKYVPATRVEEPYIHAADLKNLLALNGIEVAEEKCAEMVASADATGDGRLQLNEFLANLDWRMNLSA